MIALRENFRVTKAYIKPTIVTVARSPGSESMEMDVIESSVTDYKQRTTRSMFAPDDK